MMRVGRGAIPLFFYVDNDAFVSPLHKIEEHLVIKLCVLSTSDPTYGFFNVYIEGGMLIFYCRLKQERHGSRWAPGTVGEGFPKRVWQYGLS